MERVGLRIEKDLKQALKRLSLADGRSLSNYIIMILRQWVEDQGR